jgi:hypothetical protein
MRPAVPTVAVSLFLALTCQAVALPPGEQGPPYPYSNAPSDAVATCLSKCVDFRWIEAPFAKVLEDLQVIMQTEFRVDWEELKSSGVDRDTPVSFEARYVRFGRALGKLFSGLHVVYEVHEVRDGTVAIELRSCNRPMSAGTTAILDRLEATWEFIDLLDTLLGFINPWLEPFNWVLETSDLPYPWIHFEWLGYRD